MILVTQNRSLRLLCISYVGVVTADDLRRCRQEIETQATELGAGFTMLVDLTPLTAMDAECVTEVGHNMEVVDRLGVELVVRVIPDVSKDIGMNILTVFHYQHRPRLVTCDNMADALTAITGGFTAGA